MRIRGAKTELEAAGLETDGMAESTSKLREEILALTNVDIMLDNNTFKNTYNILDELSAKWKDLSDIQRASVTELISGKRGGNVFSSLMENFDIARNALETSQNAAGSAMTEHERAMDSITGKLNQFKASWESLSQSFISSSFVKGAIDFGTGFISTIDSITQKLGSVPTILTAIAAGLSAIKNVG